MRFSEGVAPLRPHPQLAGEFDDDFLGLAVGFDEAVDDAPQLVEANVDGRVWEASVALGLVGFGRVAIGAHNVALEDDAVVRQAVVGFGVAEVGVVRVSGVLDGFVVALPLPQMRKDVANRLEAQVDVARREFGHRKPLGAVGVQPPILLRLEADLLGVFGVDEEFDDGGLVGAFEPAVAEEFLVGEALGCLVALDRFAASPREV